MTEPRRYPEGVPSWIDCEHADLDATCAFYGELLGWTFATATPPDAPVPYVIAQLDGRDVAGLSTGDPDRGISDAWSTYVAVDDADDAVNRVAAAGGELVQGPSSAGPAGRSAWCLDDRGLAFRLWEAGARPGAQVANEPGAWNFSNLVSDDPDAATGFYSSVFGWAFDDVGFARMIRRPGYGDHLEATIDPDIRARQADAPPGFADAIGWLVGAGDDDPHWHVTFTVADRDETVTTAERLGASILATEDTEWDRSAVVRDPQGAVFTASQFTPPESSSFV